jgi:hypothetical protein
LLLLGGSASTLLVVSALILHTEVGEWLSGIAISVAFLIALRILVVRQRRGDA